MNVLLNLNSFHWLLQMIPVALSDVFFPSHSILLIFIVSVQIFLFEVSGLFSLCLILFWFNLGYHFAFYWLNFGAVWRPEGLELSRRHLRCSMGFCSCLLFYSSAYSFMALACLHVQVTISSSLKILWSYILIDLLIIQQGWLAMCCSSIQVLMTVIKYSPQVRLNYTVNSLYSSFCS